MPVIVSRDELADAIRELKPKGGTTVLVAVDGYGGSGKSTLARWLTDRLTGVTVCSDDFARPPPVAGWEWQRFAQQVLQPLLSDQVARYQRYDWDDDRLAEWHEIEPGGLVVAEGVSMTREELGDPWDLKVWVDCPFELRLQRGVERDGEDMREMWLDFWIPEEDGYVEEQRPHERGHYVVRGYQPE